MTKKVILTIAIGLFSQIGFSQNIDKTKLDAYFQALNTSNKFMGSVAVSQNGTLIYTNSIGFTDIETKTKANENSKYRIGSISKTFTAVLVLKAVEEGKLNLNQTINKYFLSIKNAEKITIGQLLYHRSGIYNFTNKEDYLKWNTQPKTEAELVEIIARAGSSFEPDSKAEYSNSNFVLLSYILEKTYKKPYSEILKEKIIQSLKLSNTYFGGKTNTKNQESYSYKFSGNWNKETETDMSIPLGAGGIVSTPTDLTKFSDALFNGKLISVKSLEQMKTLKNNYGMGLIPIPFYDQTGLGHTGGIDGFSSVFSYFQKDKISFALTSNGSNYNNNEIAIAVLSSVYGKPFEIPEFKTFALSSEDLDKYLGVYSSQQLPLKITISKDQKTLIAQATGQPSFPLDATEKDKFKFSQAGIILEFTPAENKMILKQGGGEFTFIKE